MKTKGMGKRIQIFTLIAIIVLTMQGPRVFAESLQPEKQPETIEEASVSGNDLSVFQSEDQPVEETEQTDAETDFSELTDDILNKCKVPGMNPPGVTVNLFDYWQAERAMNGPRPDMEIAHDQDYGGPRFTYEMGISKGHLLRFGYTCPEKDCEFCDKYGTFGAWNDSITGGPCQGIVKNKLGAYGFPKLNLDTKEEFGGYTKIPEREEYLSYEKKVENLSYLFSPSDLIAHEYRETYIDVQGLFQTDEDGYYYYNSTENFAFYDSDTNSFILYNSPGVAEESDNKDSCGQFFPFNEATDVFNTYIFDNGEYHLCYMNEGDSVSIDGNGYLKCDATKLNHYLGMTLEFSFQQPENGSWSNGKPMTFEFSGDDDVWIFIDGVLVADLGGLHDACSLKIDFSTGEVNVERERHTLLDSFKDAYEDDLDLGGIDFNNNTFADDTEHILKMFYLERGHGASDLALKFNTMPDEPGKEESPKEDNDDNEPPPKEDNDDNEPPPKEDNDDNEPPPNGDNNDNEQPPKEDNGDNEPPPNGDNGDNEPPPNGDNDDNQSLPNGDIDEYEESTQDIISDNDNHIMLDTTGIPRTGDDSMIGWFSALCIISLLGIGAAVCNLIFLRRKQKNNSSKH